jgi:hypothetical protein
MSATPPAAVPAGVTVLRPSPAARRRTLLLSMVALPIILLSMVINPNRAPWLILLFVVLIAAAIVFTVLRMRRMRVEYGDGRYRFVSMYRTRDFTVADVRQVHTFVALRQGATTNADLMVEGHDGQRIMRLPGILWDVGLLAALADDFQARGVPLVVAQSIVTAAEVRTRFPRLVTWFEANQGLAAVLVGVGLLLLVTIGIVVAFAVLAATSGLIT